LKTFFEPQTPGPNPSGRFLFGASAIICSGAAMTREAQTRLMNLFSRVIAVHPDWRIGQIVANVAWCARGPSNEADWEVSDEEFLAAAEAHLAHQQPQTKTA
jgi:hypothetical protein